MKNSSQKKIRIFSVVIVLVAVILLSKLYYLQIVEADYFQNQADRQHTLPSNGTLNRGTISFSDNAGNLVNAATLKSGYILAINPKLVLDKEGTYDKLNAVFPIDHTDFITKANKVTEAYEPINSQLPTDAGDAMRALKLPGVTFQNTVWRFYPDGRLGSQVLGLVGYDSTGNLRTGRYGLERYYNDVLSRDDSAVYKNFFSQIFSSIETSVQTKSVGGEGNLVLTIEPSVQSFLTDELHKIEDEYKSDQTGAIIINPQNGEIYAMAAVPDFDPNDFSKEKSPSVFVNPLVEGVFEMGSIVKPLTMAAGLDAGVVTPTTTYNDTGCITLNTKKICNYDLKARGVIPMQEVLNQSLNVGASYVESKLGNKKFSDYFKAYGLGDETGIDLPNEAKGLIQNLSSNRDVEYATASFGQGIAMTPIETVRALAALGNGGKLITPHVVKKIDYRSGIDKTLSYGDGTQVLKKETSDTITRMLVHVVDTALLHGQAKNPNYSIAAKTGTAQMANPAGGGYYADRYLHSFFGYFPAYNPQFLVFFYTVNPHGVQFASETLTKPFLDTSKFLINYYNVPPDR
jgi:cell division protein FtsI/penicillin-binding protein 2